jgi:hypothetical protein
MYQLWCSQLDSAPDGTTTAAASEETVDSCNARSYKYAFAGGLCASHTLLVNK